MTSEGGDWLLRKCIKIGVNFEVSPVLRTGVHYMNIFKYGLMTRPK